MKWINEIFSSKKVKQLEKEVQHLNTELDKRQEAINKTNAYWKKKMNDLNRRHKL
jgi:hypothetical protein